MRANFRLLLEYDGKDFEGWQVQAGGHRTVQGCLTEAFGRVTGGSASITGAGRTDAGVHAQGQVASASADTNLEPSRLLRALNAVLPRDVCVRELALAGPDFDARRCARCKLYRYRVWNSPVRSPLRAARAAFVPQALDVKAMQAAAALLEGRHDFSSFRAAGSSVQGSVRTLWRVEVSGDPGGEIVFSFEGDGFLRHMVRNLVGTLLEVGRGRQEVDSIPGLIAARDRGRAGPPAAAHGLCLVRVDLADEHSA